MQPRKLQQMESLEYAIEHYLVLDELDKILIDIRSGQRKLTAWELFRKAHKTVYGSGAVSVCSLPYGRYKSNEGFKKLVDECNLENGANLDETIRKAVRYISS